MECYAAPIGGKYLNIFCGIFSALLEVTVMLALPTQEGANKVTLSDVIDPTQIIKKHQYRPNYRLQKF